MPQVLTPAIDPALALDAEFVLWLSGGQFRAGQSVSDVLNTLAAAGSLSPAGSVVGSATDTYATNANLTTVIPNDDTIPTSTEGVQVLSVSITPKSTTNKLRCRFSGFGSTAGAPAIVAALYQGTTCIDALFVRNTADFPMPLALEAEYTPGVLTAQTISVRVGPGAAGTIRLNGTTAGRLGGGAANATLVVEEIKA